MMLFPLRIGLVMAICMVAASVSAVALRPTQKLADIAPKVDLEVMVPKQFGDWRIDTTVVPLMPAPDVQAMLNKIYNQTLARTYINGEGKRVMLSLAYGGDQTDALQIHLPEICYAAQGFQVIGNKEGEIATSLGSLPVRRLVATLGGRVEPITYWITVGDRVVNSGIKRKLAQLKYGMGGRVPDGTLVRASSIGRQEKEAFDLQAAFLQQMLLAMTPADRERLAGKPGL